MTAKSLLTPIRRVPISVCFAIGLLCMLGAIVSISVTLASGDYRAALRDALILTVVADMCLIVVLVRGGRLWRIASAVAMLPTIFVVIDFARRAQGVSSGA